MIKYVIPLLLLCPALASGQTTDLAVRTVFTSAHYTGGEFNETNPGVFLSYPSPVGGRVVGGAVKNSYGKTSAALGAQVSRSPLPYVRLSVSVGVATGYGNSSYDVGPKGLVVSSMQTLAIGPPDVQLLAIHIPGAVVIGLRVPIGGGR